MRLTRLHFLRGLSVSLGLRLFGGGRLLAAPQGWKPPKRPNLVLGAVSDTHLRTSIDGKTPGKAWPHKYFATALRYFRKQNVDAVIHCGDFAHRGQTREMEFHAEIWGNIFPGNRAPDGHVVEKLFVNGNHDVVGGTYGVEFRADKIYPDPTELAKHLLVTEMAANWERIWGEPFEEVWHKEVKGYHFFGRHYAENEKRMERKMARCVRIAVAKDGFAKGTQPFFLLSHVRPHEEFVKALRPYRNAVGFFGHNHHSASDWNNLHFFHGGTFPFIQVPSCEPRGSGALDGMSWHGSKAELCGLEAVGKCRQGYVVRVYDEMMVIERREFGEGGSLGPDWILPLGRYAPHPFEMAELRKQIGSPQFRENAQLAISETVAPVPPIDVPVKAKDAPQPAPEPVVKVEIPLANGNSASRVLAYDVEIDAGGAVPKIYRSVFAKGCNMGIGHEPDGGVTTLFVPRANLPRQGEITISVRPLSSLGTSGKAITKRIKLSGGC